MIKQYKEKIEIAEQQLDWYREVGIKGRPYRNILAEIMGYQEQIQLIEFEQQADRFRQFDDIYEQWEFNKSKGGE